MTRSDRKAVVFHVMYGQARGATPAETAAWRATCARWINEGGDWPPLCLESFRQTLDTDAPSP